MMIAMESVKIVSDLKLLSDSPACQTNKSDHERSFFIVSSNHHQKKMGNPHCGWNLSGKKTWERVFPGHLVFNSSETHKMVQLKVMIFWILN